MGKTVAAVFGVWNETAQRDHHDQWFDPDRVRVIEVDGERVGVLDATWLPEHLEVARIEIDHAHRGEGLGTEVLSALLAAADDRGQSTVLEVFHVNPSRHLYERLGFHEVSRSDTKARMVRPPPRDR